MAVTWYTNASTGANTNGGSSETVKASGAGGGGTGASWTSGVTTITLPAGTNLSTVVAGDAIRLATATGGLRSSDTFEVATVNDPADTLTVTSAPTNTASDQAFAIGGPLLTLTRVRVLQRPGEKVWIKGGTDYTETVTMAAADCGLSSGSIVWEGYTSTIGDGGMATINGSAARARGIDLRTPTDVYMVFKNIRCTNHITGGAGFDGDIATARAAFKNCRSDNNAGSSHGWHMGSACPMEGCYAHNNGGDGFFIEGFGCFLGCISNANTDRGFRMEGGVCYKCIAFSNANNNYESTQASSHIFIECGSDGDGKDTGDGFNLGVSFATSTNLVCINCWAYDCTVGFRGNPGFGERFCARNDLMNNNTTQTVDFTIFTGQQTGAPNFTDEATNNYGPAVGGSPLKNNGFGVQTNGWISQTADAPDIGPLDESSSGAGGGGAKSLKSGGHL